MHSENWCSDTTEGGYYGVRVFDRVWDFKEEIIHTLTLNKYEYISNFMSRYTRKKLVRCGLWNVEPARIQLYCYRGRVYFIKVV